MPSNHHQTTPDSLVLLYWVLCAALNTVNDVYVKNSLGDHITSLQQLLTAAIETLEQSKAPAVRTSKKKPKSGAPRHSTKQLFELMQKNWNNTHSEQTLKPPYLTNSGTFSGWKSFAAQLTMGALEAMADISSADIKAELDKMAVVSEAPLLEGWEDRVTSEAMAAMMNYSRLYSVFTKDKQTVSCCVPC